ncbi:hypothetical protein C8J57DRAFT_762876 [Mycena rebaudengoi]|nr:hypothetical protein C8J57DRAFT_762876 [Mycena rebaudengoi]
MTRFPLLMELILQRRDRDAAECLPEAAAMLAVAARRIRARREGPAVRAGGRAGGRGGLHDVRAGRGTVNVRGGRGALWCARRAGRRGWPREMRSELGVVRERRGAGRRALCLRRDDLRRCSWHQALDGLQQPDCVGVERAQSIDRGVSDRHCHVVAVPLLVHAAQPFRRALAHPDFEPHERVGQLDAVVEVRAPLLDEHSSLRREAAAVPVKFAARELHDLGEALRDEAQLDELHADARLSAPQPLHQGIAHDFDALHVVLTQRASIVDEEALRCVGELVGLQAVERVGEDGVHGFGGIHQEGIMIWALFGFFVLFKE